jgi:hypothetical protein
MVSKKEGVSVPIPVINATAVAIAEAIATARTTRCAVAMHGGVCYQREGG